MTSQILLAVCYGIEIQTSYQYNVTRFTIFSVFKCHFSFRLVGRHESLYPLSKTENVVLSASFICDLLNVKITISPTAMSDGIFSQFLLIDWFEL